MKRLLIIMLSLGLVASASAQRFHGGTGYVRAPRVIVYGAYAPFYPYYGFGFGPFGYPYPYGPYSYNRPSKLTLQIEDIKNDYKDKIWSVKHDKSLTKQDRKEKVRELKHERDQVIADKKNNYYKEK
ncbi:MAG: hypothetical protein JST75_19140 [Bacteroidetes bacterium]|nr:hypothetical protein [Bacteroidota bacterium]